MSERPGEQPRSLAEDLRARSDEQLAALLGARPDLVSPVPGDLGQLAARATTQSSVLRALDRLDRFTLQVIDVLAALPEPTTAADVRAWLGTDPTPALATLRRIALVWGGPARLCLVRTARLLVGSPAGLGPALADALPAYGPRRLAALVTDSGLEPSGDRGADTAALAGHLGNPRALDRLLQDAPPAAREVLDRLRWGPPHGRVADASRDVTVATARTPVEWLLARGLLLAADSATVTLPREIAVHLRGGRVHDGVTTAPPALETARRDPALVDRTAGGAAFTLLRHVEDLLETWGLSGPPVLRSGGLGVRDLRRTAALLDVDEPHAAFVVELAYAAGLLAASGEIDEQWWPTPAYDAWHAQEPAARWSVLATAWLETTRVPGLVGRRDEKDRVVSPLGPDVDRGVAPDVRRAVLAELAALPPGGVPTVASLDARLEWLRPRRGGRLRAELLRWTLREAELLGMTGLGALAHPGRALLGSDRASAQDVLRPLLPQPLDHVLLQADLTAVAPGPLESALAHELALMADVESKGGATVYRFGEASVRRALDAGRSASDLLATLAARSRTPVPQPLTYLVEDVARRHGRIRVGAARAYLRCDDEGLLTEILAHRRALDLRLRRLAPTVVVAQVPVDAVLERLRDLGYAPMAETPEGALVLRRPDTRRTPARHRPPRLVGEPPSPGGAMLGAAVRAIRAGDRAATAVRRAPDLAGRGPAGAAAAGAPGVAGGAGPGSLATPPAPATTLAALQSAAESGAALWIGYTSNDGRATQRVIEPISVEGGYVSAFDHLREEVRTFAVHRITGVAALAERGGT